MPDFSDIHEQQGKYLDAMELAFEHNLTSVIETAKASLLTRLVSTLVIKDGIVAQTPGNMRILRKLDSMFVQEMEKAGYGRLILAFTNEFPGQLTFLDQILHELDLPTVTWSTDDMGVFAGFRTSTVAALEGAVEAAAMTARNKVMFSIGGVPFELLVKTLADSFGTSVGRATSIADTSMSMFYRTAADRQFRVIEDGLPEGAVKYLYTGPDDKLTRPFCRAHVDRSLTRSQIDTMNNGQLPNVWLTAGGWNCRHQWVPEIKANQMRQAA